MNLFFKLVGYRRIYANRENCLLLLNLCMMREVSYTDFSTDEEGGISFYCSAHAAKRLLKLCQSRGVCIAETARGGLPHVLYRYRIRLGMCMGLLLGAFLLWFSGQFVWDVRIEGNETIGEGEVRALLAQSGIGLGSYIPSLNCSEIEVNVMLDSDRISWISIYLDGTVAMVQIRENRMPPAEESKKPANLIAACDGEIELLEIYRGESVVRIGQLVRAGDLLVSGVSDSNVVGYRYTRAGGKVLARVEQSFFIEIPLTYERCVYEDEYVGEVVLNFFDFSLKIFKNSRNPNTSCDIIKGEKSILASIFSRLPFGITLSTVYPYQTETVARTYEEALTLAYAQLASQLGMLASDVQLLQKNVTTTLTDASLILDCTVVCVRDIAVQAEFEVLP